MYYTIGRVIAAVKSRNFRLLVFVLGLLILLAALLALAYAYWPVELQRLQDTLDPTLFAPP